MKLLLFCLLASFHIISASEEWVQFKKTHQKVYKNPKGENYRKQIFHQNLELIEKQNRKYEEGLSSFSVKINKLGDLTKEEIFRSRQGTSFVTKTGNKSPLPFKFRNGDVPDSIDWRDYGVISPVPDQLWCETCWAFAVVGAIEAHVAIYQQKNVSLSQQNLVDCVDPTFTCEDYLDIEIVDKTYQYVISNGVDTADSYPYVYYHVGGCNFKSENVGAKIISYANVTEEDEEALKVVVGTIGPVTAIITTDSLWSFFEGGVYYNEDCMNTTEIFNHVVVIVGYGNENGEDYWLVKNSWGTWFAEEGYIKMARNRGNNCGIASFGRYPVVE